LEEINLSGSDMTWAKLVGANLKSANLETADLSMADFRAANLTGADLRGAYLRWSRLEGAILAYANLEGAVVTEAKLAQATSLEGAILPDGTKHSEPQLESLPPGSDETSGPQLLSSASSAQVLPNMTDILFGSDNGRTRPKGTGSLHRFREPDEESEAG
jgi:hypothetical protein